MRYICSEQHEDLWFTTQLGVCVGPEGRTLGVITAAYQLCDPKKDTGLLQASVSTSVRWGPSCRVIMKIKWKKL